MLAWSWKSQFCPSVCHMRAYCDKTKRCTADILILHERAITLYSDTNSNWQATPFPSEICTQSDPPPLKNDDFDRFPHITS